VRQVHALAGEMTVLARFTSIAVGIQSVGDRSVAAAVALSSSAVFGARHQKWAAQAEHPVAAPQAQPRMAAVAEDDGVVRVPLLVDLASQVVASLHRLAQPALLVNR
jgi:hypothetical protein